MHRRVLLAALLVAGSSVPAPGVALADERSVWVPDFPSRRFVLENGLDVYLEHDPSVPLVAVAVSYAAGGRTDPVDRPGLAHLTEHITYQGTRDLGEDQVIATLERVGAQDWNGETRDDETNYYASAPRESVSTLLWVEAQRMAYVLRHANEETVAHQRRIVAREWYEHVGDHAGSAQSSILASALFPAGHPYARPAATPAETAQLTLEDVQWFYQTNYRPSRARLAVIGDVPLDESERLVRALFGGIVDRGPRAEPVLSSPVTRTTDRAIVLRAPTSEPTMLIAWPTPGYFEPLDAELDVLSSLLCANESSVLSAALVLRTHLALDVSCVQLSRALASSFFIAVRPAQDADPGRILQVVDFVLEALSREGFDEESVEHARHDVVRTVIGNAHDGLFRARMATTWNVSSRAPVDRYTPEADLARYRAVGPETLGSTLRLLRTGGRAIVLTLPDPEAPDEGVIVEEAEVPR